MKIVKNAIQHQQAWAFVKKMALWWAKNLKIINQDGDMIPLVANSEQRELLYWIGRQWVANLPVRIMILKYRRGGFSTAVAALLYTLCHRLPFHKAFACAHDAEGTDCIFDMIQLYDEELPAEERKRKDFTNRKKLAWSAPHRSVFNVHTAGSKNLAKSREVHYLHLSEESSYPYAGTTLLSVLQTVSERPGTIIIEESTANGASGDFYDRWNRAVKHRKKYPNDLTGSLPLFFGWLDFDEYKRGVPDDYDWEELDEDELGLKGMGAKPEQLYWRRTILDTKCSGDPARFKQEYPATAEEAFQSSGRPAIAARIINHHEKTCVPAKRRVQLHRDNEAKVYAVEVKEAQYYWEIWHDPDEDTDYTVAGDVAEGQVSDPDDDKSEADSSAGVVLNRKILRVDAIWVGQIDADLFGRELAKASEWYNEAWFSPEANAVGQAALVPVKNRPYLRLYQRQRADDALNQDDAPLWGWKTTVANRDLMIDTYLSYVRPDPSLGFAGKLVILSDKIVAEERTFIVNKMGKREHARGCHDDILFALFIAIQLHQRCPRGEHNASPERTTENKTPKQSYRYAGGYDPGPEAEMEEEIECTA